MPPLTCAVILDIGPHREALAGYIDALSIGCCHVPTLLEGIHVPTGYELRNTRVHLLRVFALMTFVMRVVRCPMSWWV